MMMRHLHYTITFDMRAKKFFVEVKGDGLANGYTNHLLDTAEEFEALYNEYKSAGFLLTE